MFLITVKAVLFLTKIDKSAVFTVPKLAINWQNFAKVQLQLKFAFRIRP